MERLRPIGKVGKDLSGGRCVGGPGRFPRRSLIDGDMIYPVRVQSGGGVLRMGQGLPREKVGGRHFRSPSDPQFMGLLDNHLEAL